MSGEIAPIEEQNNLSKEFLSQDKQDLINHFHEIVGDLDYDESIKIMIENKWDLEQAVHKIMDIPIPSDVSSDSFHPSNYQDQNLPSSFSISSEGLRRRNIGLNTPVEVNNQRVIKYTPTFHSPWYWQILSMLWSPFKKLFDMFYYLISAFQPDPPIGIIDAVSDVDSFIRQLETDVAAQSSLPDFMSRSYGECVSEAKENLQFLIVYLHDNTNDCTAMVREVLCSDKFKRLIREENVLLWGCSVQCAEGHRVARLLRQNCFPFIGCIGLQSNHKLALLARIEGLFKCDELVVKLRSVLHSNETPMVAARADREERARNQNLRLQQDQDYAESLRRDREKDQVVQTQRDNEERLRSQKLVEEQKEQRRVEEISRIRDRIVSMLPQEADSVEGTLLVRIQLPNGQVSRRFYVDDSLKLLYYVVKSQLAAPWHFEISSNFPKRIWPVTPNNVEYDNTEIVRKPRPEFKDPPSFKEFGVTNNIAVMVIDNEA